MNRRKTVGILAGLAAIPFLGNEAHADFNEAEVKSFLKTLSNDFAYFNEVGNRAYTMRLTEGKIKDSKQPHLWLNITYDPEGPYGYSHGQFFMGPKSNNVSINQLTDNSMIIFPNHDSTINFVHKGKNHNGRYLLLGNPRCSSTYSWSGGAVSTPGSIEMKIGNENIDIDYMKSNSFSDLSGIYKQLI